MSKRINLIDFFTYFSGTVEQKEAVQLLQSSMPEKLLRDDSAWVEHYRKQPPAGEALDVPYFWQQDNGPEGWRQCQTSSIAMCLKYFGVPGIDDDVDYLRIVERYGDTTLQSSHQRALADLGVAAEFRNNGSKQDIIDRIDNATPVPIGILHHGPVSAPSGGGHYIVVVGYTETHAICHDPFGELRLASGGWTSQGPEDGKFIHYSWKNLLPRWDLNNGMTDGWYWCMHPF